MIRELIARLDARHRPLRVRVDDRRGLLRGWETSELGGWAAVDFGDRRPLWFPADQVVLITDQAEGAPS